MLCCLSRGRRLREVEGGGEGGLFSGALVPDVLTDTLRLVNKDWLFRVQLPSERSFLHTQLEPW
jgi:hypothetical protein